MADCCEQNLQGYFQCLVVIAIAKIVSQAPSVAWMACACAVHRLIKKRLVSSCWLAIAKLIVNSVGSFSSGRFWWFMKPYFPVLPTDQGTIGTTHCDPQDRPVRKSIGSAVSLTRFRVIARDVTGPRVEFMPLTGRTHQLRVHAADREDLGYPSWAIASMDAVHGYIWCARNFASSIRNPDKLYLRAKTPF